MSQIHKHPIPANIAERCLINPDQLQGAVPTIHNRP